MHGINTSQIEGNAEVSGITQHGFWLLLEEDELFVPFAGFPWFRNAQVEQIFHVERPHPHHLYWPDLDVDLDVESIRHPEHYPLISRVAQNTPAEP